MDSLTKPKTISIQLLEELFDANTCCENRGISCDDKANWLMRCIKCNDQGLLCDTHMEKNINKLSDKSVYWQCNICKFISFPIGTHSFEWHRI